MLPSWFHILSEYVWVRLEAKFGWGRNGTKGRQRIMKSVSRTTESQTREVWNGVGEYDA